LTSSDLIIPGQEPAKPAEPTRAEVEASIVENDRRIAALSQRGVQFDPAAISSVRVAMMTEALFGDMDDSRRLAFETRLAARYAELIDVIEQQSNIATLTQGVDLSALRWNGGRLAP
jgi:hypothetical protein